MIKIESSENKKHPWSKLQPEEAEACFRQTYPAIAKHMLRPDYREKLIKRSDQGKYFWELRSCQYWDAFDDPKIVFPDIAGSNEFAWDEREAIMGNTGYILPVSERWLAALLNSKITLWYFHKISPLLQGGFLRWIAQYVSEIPIPPATDEQKAELSDLAEKCAAAKASGDEKALSEHEARIDAIVYELFQLSPEEIRLVEASNA